MVRSNAAEKIRGGSFRLRDSANPTFETGFTAVQARVRDFGRSSLLPQIDQDPTVFRVYLFRKDSVFDPGLLPPANLTRQFRLECSVTQHPEAMLHKKVRTRILFRIRVYLE